MYSVKYVHQLKYPIVLNFQITEIIIHKTYYNEFWLVDGILAVLYGVWSWHDDEFLMKSLKSASSFFPSSVKFSLTVASFCRF